MWRAFFMAIGISLCLIGLECLVVERAVLVDRNRTQTVVDPVTFSAYSPTSAGRTIAPPEWAPWSFLSAGTVVLLYSLFLKTGG